MAARQLTYESKIKPIVDGMTLPNYTNTDCTSEVVCYLNATCPSLIAMNPSSNSSFNVYLKDDQGNSVKYRVPIWRYLVEPVSLGYTDPKYNNTCFLGFFKSNTNYAENIVIGYEFFKEYYVMYDMSPLHNHNQDYIQIGIAPREKHLDVGQIRYEPNFSGYIRANASDDISTILPGYEDQYKMPIKPDPNVKPNYPNDPDAPDDNGQGDPRGPSKKDAIWIIVTILVALLGLGVGFVCYRRRQ